MDPAASMTSAYWTCIVTVALSGTELGRPGYAITVLKVALAVTVTKTSTVAQPPELVQEMVPDKPAHWQKLEAVVLVPGVQA